MASQYDKVLAQANIREIVQHYGIKIVGNKFICPFHSDSNPSMVINDKKQIAKCFACGEGANAITFILKYETKVNHNVNFTINDAVQKAVEICNLNIDVSKLKQLSEKFQYTSNGHAYNEEEKELLKTVEFINKLSVYNMSVESSGKAVSYLEERGFDKELQQKMQFGYLPKGQLLSILDKRAETNAMRMEKAGLIRLDKNGNPQEIFSDRVMIPIFDEKGNVVAFSGRSINGEEPKYLHGVNTDIFRKRDILYNFNHARNYAYAEEMYIVEGFMDVAGGRKIGIDNVVATMGTSLSKEQLDLINKCKCEIVLMRDNDRAGKEAMLKEIPELLKAGKSISVVDLSKLETTVSLLKGNQGKDLWDFVNAGVSKKQIEDVKEPAFDYLMRNEYFHNMEINADTIHKVFVTARNDGIIKDTLDVTKYKEYITRNSQYQIEDLEDILYPKAIEDKKDPVVVFKTELMERYIIHGLEAFMESKNDKVLIGYYEEHKQQQREKMLNKFLANPEAYLSVDFKRFNAPLLMYDVLSDDKNYEKYEYLHRFQHEKVFKKAFIKNSKGEALLKLNDDQKEKVVSQFENSMSEQDMLALEEVEELYIVNDVSDLDGILDLKTEKHELTMLKERLKHQMMLNPNKMMYFKYGNIFREEDKYAIADKYKSENGEYKTFLLYNNLSKSISLTKENVRKEAEIPSSGEEQEIEKDENSKELINEDKGNKTFEETVPKDFLFSANHMLVKTENADSYFVRIPNTKGKYHMYISKQDAHWTANKEMLFCSLKRGETFPIYTAGGAKVEEWNFDQMKSKWEDKTKKQKSFSKPINQREVSLKPSEKIAEYKKGNGNTEKIKEPPIKETSLKKVPQVKIHYPTLESLKNNGYKVSRVRVLQESDKGFFIQTSQNDRSLFISSKIAKWNKEATYIEITNKKIWTNTITLYETVNGVSQRKAKLSYDDLKDYLSGTDENKKVYAVFDEDKVKVENGFLYIPMEVNGTLGLISVNQANIVRISDNHIGLFVSKSSKVPFLKNDGNPIRQLDVEHLQKGYDDALVKQKEQNELNGLFENDNKEVEMEVF